jgi:DNA-binding NtrC family response regulator
MNMTPYTIFIVDDEDTIREGLHMALQIEYNVSIFAEAESAIAALKTTPPDLILLDIGLPGMNGVDALAEIKKQRPDAIVIMITAYEDVKTVIAAMKRGAHDYVIKPINLDSLETTIRNALSTVRLRKEVQAVQEKYLTENTPFFISESNAIQDVMELVSMVSKSADTPILIIGDTGTGKEMIASAIHYRSPNFKGPFVPVNCAAIPRELVESELFGYERGAFSGAKSSGKRGLVEEAAGGTLFLDEIGDLGPEAQAKLLRFLEEGEFYRVGSTKKMHVQTRVVSATNRDLDQMIGEKQFRKDLFFRLGVVRLELPSLNERKSDILPLAEHFLGEFCQKFQKSFKGISQTATDALHQHKWTGNIRELKNVIERAVLIGQGPELTEKDMGLASDTEKKLTRSFPPIPPNGFDFTAFEESVESFYLNEALSMANGNESQAARLLQLNHHTFRYRLKKYRPQEE